MHPPHCQMKTHSQCHNPSNSTIMNPNPLIKQMHQSPKKFTDFPQSIMNSLEISEFFKKSIHLLIPEFWSASADLSEITTSTTDSQLTMR